MSRSRRVDSAHLRPAGPLATRTAPALLRVLPVLPAPGAGRHRLSRLLRLGLRRLDLRLRRLLLHRRLPPLHLGLRPCLLYRPHLLHRRLRL